MKCAGLVAEVRQFPLQLQEPVGELMFKSGGGLFAALAFGCLAIGRQQIRPGNHLRIERRIRNVQ